MRALAIDFGKRRVGLAVSDPSGTIATPLPMIDRKTTTGWRDVLLGQIESLGVTEIVVGLAKNMDGTEGPAAQDCQRFADELREKVSVPVSLLDERLTSVAAHASLREGGTSQRRGREKVDSIAASLLLQVYLERRQRRD